MIKPIGDRIAISPIYDPDTTPSGLIHIPKEAKERCDQGIVKYKGPLVSDEIQIGDHVSFSGYTGTTVRIGSGHGDYESDEILIMVPEPFIIMKIMGVVTSCPGLYFKNAKVEDVGLIDVVAEITYKLAQVANLSDEMSGEVMTIIMEALRIHDDRYFEATHEKVIEHIAWLISSDKTHREKFGIVNRAAFKPKPGEYVGLR